MFIPRRRILVAVLVACVAGQGLWSRPARSQESDDSEPASSSEDESNAEGANEAEDKGTSSDTDDNTEKERAREALELIRKGEKAAEAERFEVAVGYFKEAYELSARPGILVKLGEAAEKLDRTEEAIDYYERFLDEAPEDQESAIETIETRIEKLRASLRATLTIQTRPGGASIRIGSRDSELVGTAPLSETREPGETVVFAAKEGYEVARRTVSLEPGSETSVTLELAASSSEETDGEKTKKEEKKGAAALYEISRNKGWNARRNTLIWGGTIASLGVVGLGAGVTYTILESQTRRRSEAATSDAERQSLAARAIDRNRIELAAYTAGGFMVALGGGLLTYSLFMETSYEVSTLRLRPRGGVGRDGAWAGIGLEF